MKSSAPFDDILHSRPAVRLLRSLALFPTKEFTGRELAREVGVPPSVAIAELNRFLNQGLVRRRTAGRAQLWKLDPSQTLAQKIRELFEFEYGLDKDLRQTISHGVREIVGVERAVLFGSMARGDATPTSDIDLLVVVKSKARKDAVLEALAPLRGAVAQRFGNRLSPILYSQQEWRSRKSAELVRTLEREGRAVWERTGQKPDPLARAPGRSTWAKPRSSIASWRMRSGGRTGTASVSRPSTP